MVGFLLAFDPQAPQLLANTITMASPSKSPAPDQVPLDHEATNPQQTEVPNSEHSKSIRTISKTPEPVTDQPDIIASTQSSPSVPEPYDWEEFERRYEEALREANEHEREILKEADGLSKVRLDAVRLCMGTLTLMQYFRAWASAASVHDDERAVKRLQTRKRFVNLSEQRMEQKQQHCESPLIFPPLCLNPVSCCLLDEEVVKAFESALALLRST